MCGRAKSFAGTQPSSDPLNLHQTWPSAADSAFFNQANVVGGTLSTA
jgi:hypothetical protein